jgi:4-amino-4-deoxy-L-arabinose transferase-like glycosyltransferase
LLKRQEKNFTLTVVQAAVIFSCFIVAITELLNLFNAITLWHVLVCWILAAAACCFYIYRQRSMIVPACKNAMQNIKTAPVVNKVCGGVVTVIFLLLLYQGLIYPPNNWDSMSYHMTRIVYWLGNGSVNHFPTYMLRNLYQPPLGEYYIMHICLTNGNDYLANSVQLIFLALCGAALWEIIRQINVTPAYRWVAIIIAVTIPSAELQASTTKNDIICAFFMLATFLYAIKTYNYNIPKNFILLGLSIGLAMFTKGTAYVFLAPLLAVFAIAVSIKVFKTKAYSAFTWCLVAALLAILVNTGHYYRNYQVNHNIINVDDAEARAYSNEKMDLKRLASSIIKNAGLHLGYPVALQADNAIINWHNKTNVNINDPLNNYLDTKYQSPIEIKTNEDLVPNTLHFILTALAIAALLIFGYKKKNHKLALLSITILLLQALLFAAYLKWQPWHTRLHIPLFILGALIVACAAYMVKWYRYLLIGCLPLLLYSFYFYYAYNNLRPVKPNLYYTARIGPDDARFTKYFAARPELYADYMEVEKILDNDTIKKVGTMISDWEYPLFCNYYYSPKTVVVLNVANNTVKLPQNAGNIDVIVTNNINNKTFNFAGKEYVNQTPSNTHIWIYK